MKQILFTLLLLSASGWTMAQQVVSRSEPKRPDWLAHHTPAPSNNSFVYHITETVHENLDEARGSALQQLSTYIEQTNHITGSAESRIEKTSTGESERYRFHYTVQGEPVSITFEKKDEYWEYISYPNGSNAYRCYTLYAVAKKHSGAKFDPLTFSRKYGARGAVRSLIIPGWGQMHKGSTAKGIVILAGEAALIGGVVFTENERASYEKLKYENPSLMKEYSTKVENWETARNVCIGAAAALYIYNLVDALVANGRKRTTVNKASHFAMIPALLDNSTYGISLTYNF